MKPRRMAILGAGFWAPFQLAAWREVGGVECMAVVDRDIAKARALAERMHIDAVYADAGQMFQQQRIDFVDIVTDVDSHVALAQMAAAAGVAVICQKPLAARLAEATALVVECAEAGVPLMVHENWRWQTPLRALKRVLDSGRLGRLVRGRIDYANSFPVFDNQPLLKQYEQFILMDIGTHILDVARFLWGEASELYCQTRRMHTDICGEDMATVMMRMTDGLTVTCNMSYASKWELDRFPETFVVVEGTQGGVSLGPDYWLTVVTDDGVERFQAAPPHYSWADPAYALIHSSIVDCHRNLLGGLCGILPAETTGADNLNTLRLVFAAYESAACGQVVSVGGDQGSITAARE
jgi:D-apiose dehydrogenase